MWSKSLIYMLTWTFWLKKGCWTKWGSLALNVRLTLVLIGLLNTFHLIVCSQEWMLKNRWLSRGHQCQLSSSNHWLEHWGTGKSSANIEQGQTVNGALVSPLVCVMLLMLVSLMLFNCCRFYLIYSTDIRTQVLRMCDLQRLLVKYVLGDKREIKQNRKWVSAFLSLQPFKMQKCCFYVSSSWVKGLKL